MFLFFPWWKKRHISVCISTCAHAECQAHTQDDTAVTAVPLSSVKGTFEMASRPGWWHRGPSCRRKLCVSSCSPTTVIHGCHFLSLWYFLCWWWGHLMRVIWSHSVLVLLSHVAGMEPHVCSAWGVPVRLPHGMCQKWRRGWRGQALAQSWVPRASLCAREQSPACGHVFAQSLKLLIFRFMALFCLTKSAVNAFYCSFYFLHCILQLRNFWWVLFCDFCWLSHLLL